MASALHARPMVRLDTMIPAALDDALNSLVLMSGVSKMSLIREGLSLYTVATGTLLADQAEQVKPVRTKGPGIASKPRKKN